MTNKEEIKNELDKLDQALKDNVTSLKEKLLKEQGNIELLPMILHSLNDRTWSQRVKKVLTEQSLWFLPACFTLLVAIGLQLGGFISVASFLMACSIVWAVVIVINTGISLIVARTDYAHIKGVIDEALAQESEKQS